jgi:hypothetical protein
MTSGILVAVACGVLLLSASCVTVNTAQYRVLEDDEISRQISQEVNAVNNRVMEALQTGDFDSFFSLYITNAPNGLQVDRAALLSVFPKMTELAKGKEFAAHRDYYITWTGKGSIRAVTLPANDNDITLFLDRIEDEMFVSLMRSHEFNSLMVSLAYARQAGEWMLCYAHIGSFEIANKGAGQWYEEALTLEERGELIPAVFRIQMAEECSRSAPFTQHAARNKITGLSQKLEIEVTAKYSFPAEVSLPGSPLIYYLAPQFVQNDLLPVVRYVTTIPLEDVKQLEDEARAMATLVMDMYPRIAHGASHIVFKAYAEPPTDPSRYYNSYGTVVEVAQ